MRPLLLASLALTTTLLSALTPSVAEACGGYVERSPAVFVVDHHNVLGAGPDRWQRRAFVLIGGGAAGAAATELNWRRLAPHTFDAAKIADLPDLTSSTTFTLVGPSGSRVVSTNRLALLAQTFREDAPQRALEIEVDAASRFEVAVLGTQPDAKWLATTSERPTKRAIAWVKSQGIDSADVSVTNIPGTNIKVLSAYKPGATVPTSFVQIDGTSIGAYEARPLGALEVGGKRYVLLEQDGVITVI